jgi:ubiquinol-cytochrome c reductase cytochrome c1 subunit
MGYLFKIATGFILGAFFLSADGAKTPPKQNWAFNGMTGTYPKDALQRGLYVYQQKCAVCHGLNLLHFRNLKSLGFSDAEVKAIAAKVTVMDGPNDEGEMFERPAEPKDRFPSPYPNEQAARLANNGALPPDLSTIVKGRLGGANYIYALLTGYQDPPEGVSVGEGMYYNPYMAGGQIAMIPPLMENMLEYADNTPASIEQMAKDVTTFLAWASEMENDERKELGIQILLFLSFMVVLFYLVNKKTWANIKK